MNAEAICKMEFPPCPKFDICDENYFVTSTGIGHRIIQPVNVAKQSLDYKIPKELKEQSVILKEDIKHSTYTQSYSSGYSENDPLKRSRIACTTVHYISKFGERMKLNPLNPFNIFKSEYQEKYPYFSVHPPNTGCVNNDIDVFCKIVCLDKDQRPLVTSGSDGYTKYADPYNSTTQLVHHEFDPNDILKYNTKLELPKSELSSRVKPVYDCVVFRNKYIEKILPKVIRHVPHSGMEAEMKGSYRTPIDEMSHFCNRRPTRHLCMPPVTGASKTDTYLVPFMYHTEYNQLGRSLHSCDTRL